jgi:enamine deaminase RidA (YjgF/YER057c/UK114 family)
VRVGELVFTSGQLPMVEGRLIATGKLGGGLDVDAAAPAARAAVLNALAQVAQAAGGIDQVVRIVRLGVFVNSAAGFTDQPKVANAASSLLVNIFGEAGRHARSAVGVNELPLDAAIEIDMIAQVR